MNYRSLRMAQLIRDELSKLLIREIEFDGALVTITEVVVTDKLDHAKVLVSVIPPIKESETIKKLVTAQGDLQHKLLRKLNIKPMPRIRFELDHGPENAARVEKKLLEENNKE